MDPEGSVPSGSARLGTCPGHTPLPASCGQLTCSWFETGTHYNRCWDIPTHLHDSTDLLQTQIPKPP